MDKMLVDEILVDEILVDEILVDEILVNFNNLKIQADVSSVSKKRKPKLIIEEDEETDKILPDLTNDAIYLKENTPQNKNIINKGTGAGGANTNYYGKKFEEKTNNEKRLLEMGYTKHSFTEKLNKQNGYYLSKTFEDKTIIFVSQQGLKKYMKKNHNIELFRCPDEAYIIEYNDGKKIIKILEKKEQNVEGSVDTKLLTGPIFREEYEEALEGKFKVVYAYCVSEFLQKKILSNTKKFIIFNKLMEKHNISILFGDDTNYFETFDAWLNLINHNNNNDNNS